MPAYSAESEELSRTWDERPDVIKDFLEVRPQYDQLCNEIAYILRKRMDENAIEYSTITHRAKTLKSFAEKLSRKHYKKPLSDVTDLAGVRLVFLYKSDRSKIEEILESEFEVIEKVDKIDEEDADKFGYGALHYLVHLGRKSSGARYDDLKGMICEIQVRTVLQDSWAIIDHHLSYKQESDVPKILRRKLNSLAGLFETADDQFESVRSEREEYKQSVKKMRNTRAKFLGQETDLDTLTEFLRGRFPKMKIARDDGHLSRILSRAINYGYSTLKDLENLVQRTEKARAAIHAKKKAPFSVSEVARAIALEHPDYRVSGNWTEATRKLFKQHEHLLKK